MRKFIFTFAFVALVGTFASCGNCTKNDANVTDTTVVDTTLVDTVDSVR